MILASLVKDIAAGALAGATGGKIDIGRAVDKAISKAVQSPDTDLTHNDAPAVAEVVKDAIPDPKAMEGLGWQNFRILLMVGGSSLVSLGVMEQGDVEPLVNATMMLVGALMVIIPWGYRNVSTWLARAQAKG